MDIEVGESKKKILNNPFVSLRHKNYRLYWICICISMIGTWMQNIAQPWLAYTITGSPWLLSLVSVMQSVPVFLFSIFAGVLIDRFPKKKILFITQSALAIITLILAILVWTNQVRYWHILLLATAMGIVNSLDIPTRQSFVVELVGKEDLMNAIALNSSVFNTARIIGPALAGLAMGYLGIAYCFLINSISFTAMIFCLYFIKPLTSTQVRKSTAHLFSDLKGGLHYVFQSRIILKTLLSTAVVTTFAMNFNTLVPVFANRILLLDETGFGFLMSIMGFGSLAGALFVAMLSKNGPMKFILNLMPILIAGLLVLIKFTQVPWLTGLCLALIGFGTVAFTSTTNSTVQLNTDDFYRGRIMSLYILVWNGTSLFGSLFAGFVADRFGPDIAFAACGIMMALLIILVNVLGNISHRQTYDRP